VAPVFIVGITGQIGTAFLEMNMTSNNDAKPNNLNAGKRCTVYCGDACNCDLRNSEELPMTNPKDSDVMPDEIRAKRGVRYE